MRIPLPARLAAVAVCLVITAGCSPEASPDASATEASGNAASTPVVEPPAPVDARARADASTSVVGIPERFHGTWAADAAACGSPGHESRLSIDASHVGFHESSGEIVSAQVDGDHLALRLRMRGEGQAWDADYGFRLSSDGQTLAADDGGLVRERCG